MFGIPIGDPKFLVEALVHEISYVMLAIITEKRFKYAYIPNFIIAGTVITGNTLSRKHSEIILTLHPFYNAIILIVGGYVLQGFLLITNALTYRHHKHLTVGNRIH